MIFRKILAAGEPRLKPRHFVESLAGNKIGVILSRLPATAVSPLSLWEVHMKPIQTAALLAFLLPALVSLQGKTKQPIVPAVFNNARYIYVEAVDGQQFDPRLYPEDRQAIADVQDAMRAWQPLHAYHAARPGRPRHCGAQRPRRRGKGGRERGHGL